MARCQFGGTLADFQTSAKAGPSFRSGTVWTAQTGGTQITDLLSMSGQSMTTLGASAVSGGFIQFQGPDDGTSVVYVDCSAAQRVKMIADPVGVFAPVGEPLATGLIEAHLADTGNPHVVTAAQTDITLGGFDLTSGEAAWPWPARGGLNTSGFPISTQRLQLTYFRARRTESITRVSIATGGTAAAATPTVCRMGIYTVDALGDGTLTAAIANDTTLFATLGTTYTRNLTATLNKVAGQLYAFGILVVSGAALPTFYGNSVIPQGFPAAGGTGAAPKIAQTLGSQADLPASFTDAGLSSTNAGPILGVLLP